jgi:type IV pilus assembly protein PilF
MMNRAIDRLAKSALALLAMTILSACVSTDSNGYRNDPESDAANQNYQLGARYYQQSRFDEAIVQFERAIGIVENESTYLMMTNAAVCIAKKPDLQIAEQYLRDALMVKPSHGEALIQMVSLQHRNDDNLRARAFMERFLAANPSSASVLYLAVQIETQNQDDRAATDYTNQLIRVLPESPEARLLLQQG